MTEFKIGGQCRLKLSVNNTEFNYVYHGRDYGIIDLAGPDEDDPSIYLKLETRNGSFWYSAEYFEPSDLDTAAE